MALRLLAVGQLELARRGHDSSRVPHHLAQLHVQQIGRKVEAGVEALRDVGEQHEPLAFVGCHGRAQVLLAPDVVRLVNDNERVLAANLLRGLELDAPARNLGDARTVANLLSFVDR